MRPIPAPKHLRALAVLLAVVVLNTVLVFREEEATGEQANMLAEVVKRADPSLYPHDEVFGPAGPNAPWRLHQPAWQAILSAAWRIGGQDEPLNAFRLLSAPMLLLYLLSMYILVYRQTHSTTAATVVAIISMAMFQVSRPVWGLGPLFSITPNGLVLTVTPLLILMMLRRRARWIVAVVFFAAGLTANIHLWSAVNLVLVMLLTLVALGRARPRAWLLAGASAAVAFVGMAPALVHLVRVLGPEGLKWSTLPLPLIRQAFQAAGLNVFYPDVLSEFLRWLVVAVILIFPAVFVLSRAGRYRVSDLSGWTWLLVAALVVAFVLHGAVQAVSWLTGRVPPWVELHEALGLAMLPLYVLFAHAMVHLIRLARTHAGWVRAAMGVFAALFLLGSYNTMALRHMVRDSLAALSRVNDTASQPANNPDQLMAGQPGQDLDAPTPFSPAQELRRIGLWAEDQENTSPDALFITRRAELRMYGRRSLLVCGDDVRYIYRAWPLRLPLWLQRVTLQRAMLRPGESARVNEQELLSFADEYWAVSRRRRSATYVIVPASFAPAPSPDARLQEVQPLDDAWGRHWRLFQVLEQAPAARASRPAATTAPLFTPTTTTAPASAATLPAAARIR